MVGVRGYEGQWLLLAIRKDFTALTTGAVLAVRTCSSSALWDGLGLVGGVVSPAQPGLCCVQGTP